MRKALNAKAIEAFKPKEKRYEVHDILCPGFSMRVYPTGKKVFTLKYRHDLKQRRLPLGVFPRLTLALACCSCSALTNTSQFAVRCSGNVSTNVEGGDGPSVRNEDARTYVIDGDRNVIYRADPYVVQNLCAPNGRCDVEVTQNRVTALISRQFDAREAKSRYETRFVLDRDKGELRTTDTSKMTFDGETREPIKMEGSFTCVSVPVPDFKVPEA